MRFLRPDLASWALVLPLLVAFWALRRRARASFRRRLPIAPRFERLSRRSSLARDFAVLSLALLTGGALVFALVRPQLLLTRRVPEYEQQDLVVLLDRSISMRAHDIRPSRFTRATLELRNFIRNRPESIGRVALVGFADSSVVLSYLTNDTENLLFYLDWIDQDPTPFLGTNIGAALTSAMDVIKKDNRNTRKLLLIVSDGEDYGGELERAIATVRAKDLRVNTIGIGSDRAVPIPLLQPDGRESVLRGDDGAPVMTKFSENTLRSIAAQTGGRYARSTTGEELEHEIADAAGSERRIIGWQTTTEYRDLYEAALAVAAGAGAALWLLL